MIKLIELEPEEAISELKDFKESVRRWCNIVPENKTRILEVADYAILLIEQEAGI